MTTQKGLDFLLKVSDGGSPDAFTTLGGMQTTGMTINNEQVETTNKDDSRHRSLLSGAGVQSMTVTASGVFKDTVSEQKMLEYAEQNANQPFQLVFPDLGVFEGLFQVASLEYTGDHNTAMAYNVTLESAAQIFRSPPV